MNVSDRITELLNHYNLKAGDFATSIDVTPATISNLRNGKTSLTSSIAQKIKNTYPELNFQWILLGEGNMFQSTENKMDKTGYSVTKPYSDELFPIESEEQGAIVESEPVKKVEVHEPQQQPVVNNTTKVNPMVKTIVQTVSPNVKTIEVPVPAKQRTIEKIIIYYNDKTFEEYDLTKCKI